MSDITKLARKVVEKTVEEVKRTPGNIKKGVDHLGDQVKPEVDRIVGDIDHATGVNVKPIVKSIAGPAHILAKIAEGHNLAEATNDWVVNNIEGAGEISGVFGSDAEKVARTITSYSNVPVLLLTNLAGDTVKVVEREGDFGDIVGSPLATFIEQAHAVYEKHKRELELGTKIVLKHIVDPETLKRARFVIDMTPDNVAGLANKLNHDFAGRPHAVTVDDIVVFSSPPSSDLGGFLHWVHELKHVEQYQRWGGILGFAERYTKDYKEVEEEASVAETDAKTVLEDIINELEG